MVPYYMHHIFTYPIFITLGLIYSMRKETKDLASTGGLFQVPKHFTCSFFIANKVVQFIHAISFIVGVIFSFISVVSHMETHVALRHRKTMMMMVNVGILVSPHILPNTAHRMIGSRLSTPSVLLIFCVNPDQLLLIFL